VLIDDFLFQGKQFKPVLVVLKVPLYSPPELA
jgi:hypothetical protein